MAYPHLVQPSAGDDRQALRTRRFLMAAGTSLIVIVLLAVSYYFGGLEWTGLVQGTAIILFWDAVFFTALRTGFNLRFKDPSLTVPQLATSIVTMAYIMYYADRGRGALLVVFLVAFLFGVFRLRTRQLLMLAATAIASFGVMVLALYQAKPNTVELADEILQLIVLAIILPWFAAMGGYVSQLRDNMRDSNRQLEAAKTAAESAAMAKTTFLASMSHEIRTPMNGVVGMVDVLQQSHLTRYQRDLAGTIKESAFALLRIIEDVLDFSKIEAGHMTLESEAVSLRRLVESVCDGFQASAASRSVSLHVSIDPDLPPWIESDAVRLRQILNNLLDNAIKFSSGTARVGRVGLWVECAASGFFQLRVVDNGIGMAPEVVSRIFQPFVQAEASTTRRFGGTGLGLSICRRLASLFGGWTEVASEPDRGSTFTVTLPLKAAEVESASVERSPIALAVSPARFASPVGQRVLVAEDNDINQRVIGRQLALLGLQVEMAHDGLDALARWRAGRGSRRHGLLLTDLHMPGIDGYALAAAIRSEEQDGDRLPIVALSANAMRGEIDRCKQAGMDDYLSKPVQLQQLGSMLQRWIDLSGLARLDHEWTDVQDVLSDEPLRAPTVMDERSLALLVGDDPEVLADFRQRYMISALSTMDEMRVAMAAGDFARMSALAHRLKSSSRAMGAMALGACCEEVERAGASCSGSLMHALMVHMEDALAQVMSRLTSSASQVSQRSGAMSTNGEAR